MDYLLHKPLLSASIFILGAGIIFSEGNKVWRYANYKKPINVLLVLWTIWSSLVCTATIVNYPGMHPCGAIGCSEIVNLYHLLVRISAGFVIICNWTLIFESFRGETFLTKPICNLLSSRTQRKTLLSLILALNLPFLNYTAVILFYFFKMNFSLT